MKEALFTLLGVVSIGVVLLLTKWFGGRKGDAVVAADSPEAQSAQEASAVLIGHRDAIDVEASKDQKRLEEKLNIKDSSDRLSGIADELRDL